MRRARIFYVIVISLIIPLGLSTRHYPTFFPDFIGTYGGDTLWALLAYLMFRWLWVERTLEFSLVLAFVFSFFIEISQLYQGEWLNVIRQTILGKLILGSGFLWSDFVCYTVGIFIGYILDRLFKNQGLQAFR